MKEATAIAKTILTDIENRSVQKESALGKSVDAITGLFTGDTSKSKNAVLSQLKEELTSLNNEVEAFQNKKKLLKREKLQWKFLERYFNLIRNATRDYQQIEADKSLRASPFSKVLLQHSQKLELMESRLAKPEGCVIC